MKLFKKIVKKVIPSKIYYLIIPNEKKFYSKLINTNDLCFDIGANVGRKSRIMLACGAKVIAFEPQSSCFKHLLKIKSSLFTFYPFAVGSKNEKKELNLSNYSEVATLSDNFIKYYTTYDVYWDQTEVVEVKPLDFLINEYGVPNFCKIDVEGYELEIISNLTYKIPILEFEFTGKFLNDTFKIIDYLDKKKYYYNFTLNEHLKFQIENWVSGDEIKRIINKLTLENLHGNIFCKIN